MSKTIRHQQPEEDAVADEGSALLEGLIVDGSRGQYQVETEAGVLTCTLRGRLRKILEYPEREGGRRSAQRVTVQEHDPVAVGDRVQVLPTGKSTGVIEQIVARAAGAFTRGDPDPGRGSLTTVAGLDQMAIVFAARNPEPHWGLLDRYLVVAESQTISPLIVISKIDLGLTEESQQRLALYDRLGYPVVRTSVATGEGIADLRARLAGRTTALLGKSGVGKSSLLNALEPDVAQRVSEVSGATGKGRHTTTGSRLFPLSGPEGGYLADTAGIRALGLSSDVKGHLDECFPEFRALLGGCRMRACEHTVEPDCTIREGVARGALDGQRYASYCRMLDAKVSSLDVSEDEDDPEPLAYLAGAWASGASRR